MDFFYSGHSPCTSPVDGSGIVLGFENRLAVHSAIVAVYAVLGLGGLRPVTILISCPSIDSILWLCLAPGKEVAHTLGNGGSDIARCPQCPSGQTQIHIVVTIGIKSIMDGVRLFDRKVEDVDFLDAAILCQHLVGIGAALCIAIAAPFVGLALVDGCIRLVCLRLEDGYS